MIKDNNIATITVQDWISMTGDIPSDKLLKELSHTLVTFCKEGEITPLRICEILGIDWMEILLKWNEDIEDYTTCELIWSCITQWREKYEK